MIFLFIIKIENKTDLGKTSVEFILQTRFNNYYFIDYQYSDRRQCFEIITHKYYIM